MNLRKVLSTLLAVVLCFSSAAMAETKFNMRDNFRDLRYGEILVVTGGPLNYVAKVYNTVGLNDCPQAAWDKLDPKKLAKERKAKSVLLNGPRHFMMDEIALQNPGEISDFDGLQARHLAEVDLSLFTMLRGKAKPFTENTVSRTSRYVYKKGRPVYELIAPDGTVYVLQTYALIVDPTLTAANLPNLASKLKLPKGWTYRSRILDKDLVLTTSGTAKVLQDNLENSYQRVTN